MHLLTTFCLDIEQVYFITGKYHVHLENDFGYNIFVGKFIFQA